MFEHLDLHTLNQLLTLSTKKELEVFARDAVIHSDDFVWFIMSCDLGDQPWRHRIGVQDSVPEHLFLNERDNAALSDATVGPHTKGTQKAANKMLQLFEERRLLTGHIFYTSDLSDWNFFYFDNRDREEVDNHWQHGPHIHFVNVLWPNLEPQKLWDAFCASGELPGGALHVRYKQKQLLNRTGVRC